MAFRRAARRAAELTRPQRSDGSRRARGDRGALDVAAPRSLPRKRAAPPRAPGPGGAARMKVAFMGRSLRGRYTGVVRYTDALVRALAPRLEGDLSVFLTRAADGLDGVDIRRMRAPFPTPNEYARALWEQTVGPIEVSRLRSDVYHSPNYILPLPLPCPAVAPVHDIAFLAPPLHPHTPHLYLSALPRHPLTVTP